MSTILNALQKQTANPAYSVPHTQSNKHWQMALLAALSTIIVLLGILIFILLKPAIHAVPALIQPEAVLQKKPAGEVLPAVNAVLQNKPAAKLISKVSFPTKQLPIAANKTTSGALQVAAAAASDEPPAAVLSDQTKQQEEQPEIDYSEVSNELQQRFERALLMSKDEGRAFIESENSDGSDIHQMSSDFQDQVPALSYDFHLYSSEAKERWIRINGEDLLEGQFDSSGKIQVVEIQPNRTIFRLGRQSFSLQSLTDWKGL